MTSTALPEESLDAVVSLLAPHATASESRCVDYDLGANVPRYCTAIADVQGAMVIADLTAQLLPRQPGKPARFGGGKPARFAGSDVSFYIVDGGYKPDAWFSAQEAIAEPLD